MGRILAIDWGTKRTGIAVTDPLQIIPGGLTTVATGKLDEFLDNYFSKEQVDTVVVGYPKNMDNTDSATMKHIRPLVKHLQKRYPEKIIEMFDERFTSVIAHQSMLDAGLHRMARRNKELVDEISATLILESYLDSLKNKQI